MYILYGGRYTRALITEMVLAEGGIPYEVRDVDIVAQGHRRPEYLAVNPSGWVPALVTPEGETLYETPAISLYLAERHRLTHLAPAVGDPERGRFLSGLFSVAGDLEPILKRYFYPHRYVMRDDDTPAMKERALGEALERLRVTEGRRHGKGPYHLGERFSLVDLTCATGPRRSGSWASSPRAPPSGAAWSWSPRDRSSAPISSARECGTRSTPECRHAARECDEPLPLNALPLPCPASRFTGEGRRWTRRFAIARRWRCNVPAFVTAEAGTHGKKKGRHGEGRGARAARGRAREAHGAKRTSPARESAREERRRTRA